MENNQKKGKFALSRKHFIIGMIGLCLVALIAEIVLLVHGFKKKPDEKPAEVTPTQLALLTVSPTPTTAPTKEPTPTPEVDHYESVWKLAKEYKTGNLGQKNPLTVREYDEQGRESKRLIYDEDTGELKTTAVFRYDRSGIILVDYWVPSVEDGELQETKCFHPLMIGFGRWISFPSTTEIVNYGGKVKEEECDEDGNLLFLLTSTDSIMPDSNERIEWEIDSDGNLKEYRYFEGNGVLNSTTEIVYDDLGNPIRTVTRSSYGEYTAPWSVSSKDGYTYYTEEGNGIFTYVLKDGLPLIYARYMGFNEEWPGVEAATDLSLAVPRHERGVVYSPRGNFPDFTSTVYPFSSFDEKSFNCVDYIMYQEDGSAFVDSTVEARPDGQPVFGDDFFDKYYEYDEKGRLTRYYTSPHLVDVLTELDDNWNLVKKTDLLSDIVYEYEWILVDVPVYK